jgi:hypothetical protein
MKEGFLTNSNEIQKIMKEYFKNLYSNKLENLEEMDKFLDAFDLPKLNQEDINHFNRSMASNEIEAVIKVSQKEKAQENINSLMNSTRTLKK